MTSRLDQWRAAIAPLPGREGLTEWYVDAWELAIERLRAHVDERKFTLWLETLQLQRLTNELDWVGFEEVLEEKLIDAYIATIADVGQRELDFVVGKANRLNLSFNLSNPRVFAWAQEHANDLVVELSQSTRRALNAAVLAGINTLPPRDLAPLLLNSGLGLHSRWANAVTNRAARMGVSASHPAIRAYASKLLGARARQIARTETMFAQNAGRIESWRQMQDEGLLSQRAQKEWLTGPEPCRTCQDLDSEVVPMNASFSSGDDMPPAHTNCVCTAVVVFTDKLPTSRATTPSASPGSFTRTPLHDQVEQLVRQGYSQKDIARRLGVSEYQVWKARSELGLVRTRGGTTLPQPTPTTPTTPAAQRQYFYEMEGMDTPKIEAYLRAELRARGNITTRIDLKGLEPGDARNVVSHLLHMDDALKNFKPRYGASLKQNPTTLLHNIEEGYEFLRHGAKPIMGKPSLGSGVLADYNWLRTQMRLSSYLRASGNGWHAPTNLISPVGQTFLHEFGHHLFMPTGAIDTAIKRELRQIVARGLSVEISPGGQIAASATSKLGSGISRYGATNINELDTEAFLRAVFWQGGSTDPGMPVWVREYRDVLTRLGFDFEPLKPLTLEGLGI